LNNGPEAVLKSLVHFVTRAGGEHEWRLRKIVGQLSSEFGMLLESCDRAVAHGYLVRGVRDIMWNRIEQGKTNLAAAVEQGAQIDESFLRGLIDQLMNYEIAYGPDSSEKVLHDLTYYLEPLEAQFSVTSLVGNYSINRAFHDYKSRKYEMVPGRILQAIKYDPRYLANKGVLAILFRSITRRRSWMVH
jgi:hypothetical protein